MNTIKARLEMTTIDHPPTEIGTYIVLDSDFHISMGLWNGDYFELETYGEAIAWCGDYNEALISPADQKKIGEIMDMYGEIEFKPPIP